jgi:hypothetical protein
VKNALRPVATLLVGVAILLTGSGLQGTLVPVRASIENFSTFAIDADDAYQSVGALSDDRRYAYSASYLCSPKDISPHQCAT